MIDYTKRSRTGENLDSKIDHGLKAHMISVYKYMAAGLGLSGLIAYLVVTNPAIQQIAMQGKWIWFGAMLVMAFFVLPKMYKMSTGGALSSFFGYAIVLSLMISPIFMAYTNASIARTFFITASVFMGMSLFGYTTKRDLTSLGTFAIIGIWGVFFASLINMFIGSSMIHYITSAIAVVASVALTAYDTQKIKQTYYAISQQGDALQKAAIVGALQLYFDFVYMCGNYNLWNS